MKPVRITFFYSKKQADITKRHIRFFQSNLKSIIANNKIKPIFEVKQTNTAGINLKYRDLDAGKEIILEDMNEIQEYLNMNPTNNNKQKSQSAPKDISEDFMNYALDIANEGDDDINEKEDKSRNRANELRMNSEKSKNEFKGKMDGKVMKTVGKKVSISKDHGNREPSDISSANSKRSTVARQPVSSNSRKMSAKDTDDDSLIMSKIEQSIGGSI